MQSFSCMMLLVLVLCSAVYPVHLLKVGVLGIMPTPTERGVPRTTPPEQGMVKETKVHKPLYKDYYSKTSVIVTFPVSTVLYQEQDLSIILNQTEEISSTLVQPLFMQNLTTLLPSLKPSQILTRKYDEFDWATETQIYTTALNTTATTTVVENTLPFL